MTQSKQGLRQRIWTGDKADARQVGESLRGIDAVVGGMVPTRPVTFSNQVYASNNGLTFPLATPPLGILAIHCERADGTIDPAAVTSLKVSNGNATVKLTGLATNTRYATIRLLVIG
jgi:hypothetical protein